VPKTVNPGSFRAPTIPDIQREHGRCRKFALVAKIAIILGALLTGATLLGVLTLTPMAMLGGVAALLGGIVVYGSNGSTLEELSKSLHDAEAWRAALIGRLDTRLVDVPPTRH
jgi:hypothetical protein